MYGVCGEYGGMVSIIPNGIVSYVSKHKRKISLERLGAFWSGLKQFGTV